MTEPNPNPTPEPIPAPEPGAEPLNEGGMKALRAERDARQQAERELADLRKQIDDAAKTAEQKAADDLAAMTGQRDAAQAQALRYEVAAAKGIDIKFAPRLTGTTREELEADADTLAELVKPAHRQPLPDPSAGRGGIGDPVTHASGEAAIAAHYQPAG